MDRAARNNRKNVVQWLHEHRNEGCTPAAMDRAAGAGHLEMVRWLHTHRKEGCTTDAMDTAAGGGHLDVIKWLHANRSEGCKTWAMNSAAASGHLEVVKWLHANRREGCTVEAMTDAAINGHLAVVKWLHENRSEGCRADTMGQAAEKGHLEVVKFLHKNRGEVDARLAMEKATEFGRFEVVLYLHAEHVKVRDLDDGTVLGRLSWEMAEWLITNYAEQPCVFINVRNIGNIDSDHNPKTAKALTETVTEVLNVPADRVFLNLEDISAGNWAFAGGRWSHAPVRGRPKVTRYHLLHGKNSKTMQAFMQCVPSSAALPGSTRELNPKIAVSLAATAAEVLADRVFLI
ncbi:hypothetical protein BBJ28_00010031 [Nothophytophthora sp. Chile5]|nr:hypothetical protein BBJ28_00010031 [Nothophytophthora sp. Chile5]